jgi:hypothetical protein
LAADEDAGGPRGLISSSALCHIQKEMLGSSIT